MISFAIPLHWLTSPFSDITSEKSTFQKPIKNLVWTLPSFRHELYIFLCYAQLWNLRNFLFNLFLSIVLFLKKLPSLFCQWLLKKMWNLPFVSLTHISLIGYSSLLLLFFVFFFNEKHSSLMFWITRFLELNYPIAESVKFVFIIYCLFIYLFIDCVD